VRVRALIPMQLHLYHQILVQQESLEAGLIELGQWLENAELLLQSHCTSVTNVSSARDQLDKHRQFFTRLLYYRYIFLHSYYIYQNKSLRINYIYNIQILI